jgi:hypothetical protein
MYVYGQHGVSIYGEKDGKTTITPVQFHDNRFEDQQAGA